MKSCPVPAAMQQPGSRVIQWGVTSVNESQRAERQLSAILPRSRTVCSIPNASR
jgi:hypothetical protein